MNRLVTLLGYGLLLAVAAGLEVVARRRHTATVGDALHHALRWRPTRLMLLAGWLWLGWHVFVRVDWH